MAVLINGCKYLSVNEKLYLENNNRLNKVWNDDISCQLKFNQQHLLVFFRVVWRLEPISFNLRLSFSALNLTTVKGDENV